MLMGVAARFIAGTLAVPLCCAVFPQIQAASFEAALLVGACLAVVYLALRPLLKLLTLPLGVLTLGLAGAVVDALLVYVLCTRVLPGMIVFEQIWWVAVMAVAVNVLRALAGRLVKNL